MSDIVSCLFDSLETSTYNMHKKLKKENWNNMEEKKVFSDTDLLAREYEKPVFITDQELRDEVLTEQEKEALDKFKENNEDLCKGRSEVFIMLFIWARKLDLERSAELLRNHMALREKHDLDNINMEWVKENLSSKMTVSPQLAGVDSVDKLGRCVGFILPINMTKLPPEYLKDKTLFVKKMIQVSWWVLENIFFQKKFIGHFREGVVYVEDFKDVSLMKMMGVADQSLMKEMMGSMQDALPLRIRQICLTNFPLWLRVLVAIAKPFMKKKLRNKIQVLASREEIRNVIEDKHLLKELGGELEVDVNHWIDHSGLFDQVGKQEALPPKD